MNDNISKIRDLTWEEVFLFWYESEGNNPDWQNLAKERGYASWADWRLSSYAAPFGCDRADWALYSIKNLGETISEFYGGPFSTWIKRHYDGKREKTFRELIEQPEIIENEKINELANNYPVKSKIVCLQLGNKVYVIEGMHRCCALAMMHNVKIPLPENIEITIGKSDLKELPRAGEAKPSYLPT